MALAFFCRGIMEIVNESNLSSTYPFHLEFLQIINQICLASLICMEFSIFMQMSKNTIHPKAKNLKFENLKVNKAFKVQSLHLLSKLIQLPI